MFRKFQIAVFLLFLSIFSSTFASETKCFKKRKKTVDEVLLDFASNYTNLDKKKFLLKCKIIKGIPTWMQSQIEREFSFYKNKTISKSKLNEFFLNKEGKGLLVKYTIRNNQVFKETNWFSRFPLQRAVIFEKVLQKLCDRVGLPDTTFLLSVEDGLHEYSSEVPIFVMCKHEDDKNLILIPDYEAITGNYQVLKNRDITRVEPIWEAKKAKLIWRGSTAQRKLFNSENLPYYSRVSLCELSDEYPELIDAKFTLFAQVGKEWPELQKYRGARISFEEEALHKYHILIDGNVTSYSRSCWKLLVNSLVFKPDSKWVQWYFSLLKPYVHYVPVKENLEDLIEKVKWAQEHDAESKKIAHNAREFALNHLTQQDNMLYLYFVLQKYHQLKFVE